jgi:malate dehydrogenase (oxaloacetate-decarboxylating)(NADP+)
VNPQSDPRYRVYHEEYFKITQRCGVSPQYARIEMRRRATLIGAMMIHLGDADGLICGTFGSHELHLHYINQVIGARTGVRNYYALNVLMLPKRTLFICDTGVQQDPTAEQIAEMAWLAAEKVRQFGLQPKAALVSHSSFGSSDSPSALKMRHALHLIEQYAPDLEVEGEMHGDAALSEAVRQAIFPNSRLQGEANLLLMPNLDAANISFNLLKTASGDGVTIGPMLLGAAKPIHIVSPSATVRRLVNMTAITAMDVNRVRPPTK